MAAVQKVHGGAWMGTDVQWHPQNSNRHKQRTMWPQQRRMRSQCLMTLTGKVDNLKMCGVQKTSYLSEFLICSSKSGKFLATDDNFEIQIEISGK